MQSQSVSRLFVTAGTMLVALYMAFDVLSSGGNAVGKLYRYAMVASALFGFLSPRLAFTYLILLTAYLDYFKRLMIFDSGVSTFDLYCVLGIAPLTLAGILTSVIYAQIQGGSKAVKGQVTWTLSVVGVMAVLMTVQLLIGGGGGQGGGSKLGEAVNFIAYAALLVVVPFLFPTPQDLQALLRRTVLIFFPAALYMIYHGFAGITDWEMRYVKSGLTIEIRQLREVKFRPFGTLNSAASATSVFSLLAVLVLFGPWNKSDESGVSRKGIGPVFQFLTFTAFVMAAAFTLTRTGWVQGLAGVVAALMFAGRFRTKVFYATTVGAVLAVFLGSAWILKSGWFERIEAIINDSAGSDIERRAVTISTFSDRMYSYSRLVNTPELWTPFGWKMSGRSQSSRPIDHDAVSELVLSFGYVPMSLAAIFGIWALFRIHKITLSEKTPLNRSLAIVSAASFFGYALGGMANGSQLKMFPVNFFMWLFPAVIVALEFHHRRNLVNQPPPALKRESYPVFSQRQTALKFARNAGGG